ncbi:MAG TPA: hypothetical protein VFC89_07315, partial [Oscillospiraceae bacterium]|nr:hypothetical protein [Oscillospiraceae bacterium]
AGLPGVQAVTANAISKAKIKLKTFKLFFNFSSSLSFKWIFHSAILITRSGPKTVINLFLRGT